MSIQEYEARQERIRRALECPYCFGETELAPSSRVYGNGRDFGNLWVCKRYPGCDAYVGCHKNTKRPKGRLANRDLRDAKIKAHAAFDPLWKAKIDRHQVSFGEARKAGYVWLSQQMGLPFDLTHIGMFDADQCRKVELLCLPYLRRIRDGRR